MFQTRAKRFAVKNVRYLVFSLMPFIKYLLYKGLHMFKNLGKYRHIFGLYL